MRIYIIASVLIILGLIAIAYQSSLPTGSWQLPYVTNLSSALLVGGLISLLFRSFQERESDKTLRRLMRIHDSVDELGLVEIVAQHQGYNFTGIIEMSDHLTIVMNDGLRWIGNNTVALRIRFGKDGLTELFTVDPDSPFVESLARKTSVSTEDLKKKIHDTWRRLEETYNDSTKQGKLKIYRLKTYPTRSIFQTEDRIRQRAVALIFLRSFIEGWRRQTRYTNLPSTISMRCAKKLRWRRSTLDCLQPCVAN